MATIANLIVGVQADIDGLKKGLAQARGELANFDKVIGGFAAGVGIGAAVFALDKLGDAAHQAFSALVDEVKNQLDVVDNLGKMADRLGITTEAMAAFEHAAALSGNSLEEVEAGMARMNRTLGEAQIGGREAQQAFAQIGLDPQALAGMDPGEAFWQTADAINALSTAQERAAATQAIFGRGGQRLQTFLATGSKGFREMTAEADRLGKTFSREQFMQVQNANDALTRMKALWEGIARQVAIGISPAIEQAAIHILAASAGMAEWGVAADKVQNSLEVLMFTAAKLDDQFTSAIQHVILAYLELTRVQTEMAVAAGLATPEQLEEVNRQVIALRAVMEESANLSERRLAASLRDAESRLRDMVEHFKNMVAQAKVLAELARFQEAARTPLDRFEADFLAMEMFVRQGRLLERDMARNVGKAFRGLGGGQAPPAPGLALRGSREAFQARAAFERGGRDPLMDVPKILDAMRQGQERHDAADLELLKQIRDALIGEGAGWQTITW